MSLFSMLLVTVMVIGLLMLLLWAVSLQTSDASLVDRFWGFGFVLVVWVRFTLHAVNQEPQSLLLPVLVTLWGLRLSGYLTWRNWGQAEDFRYRAMRERHGKWFPWVSLVTVFVLQGVVMWVVALPLQLRQDAPLTWNLRLVVGLLLWIIGFAFYAPPQLFRQRVGVVGSDDRRAHWNRTDLDSDQSRRDDPLPAVRFGCTLAGIHPRQADCRLSRLRPANEPLPALAAPLKSRSSGVTFYGSTLSALSHRIFVNRNFPRL